MLQEHVDQNKGGSKYIFHYKQLDCPYLMVEKLAVPSIKQLVYQTSDTNYTLILANGSFDVRSKQSTSIERRSPTRHGLVSFAGSVATTIHRSQGRAGLRII